MRVMKLNRISTADAASPRKRCTLCQENHATHKCIKYKEPEHKLRRLEELNGCKKCANIGHTTDKCKLKFFKKCYFCKGWHFSFLCDHQGEKSHDEKLQVNARGSKEVKAGNSKHRETSRDVMIITKALHTTDGASVLPTITCEMLSGALVRGLKDCGCQTSFVTEKLASDSRLKVLKDNVSLTVNGFNSRISEVAGAFAKKGFKLADKYLTDGSDKIKDIDLILCTNDAHCLLDFSVKFGNDHPYVYLGSAAGVMLMGNVKVMQQNLPYLSNDFSCSRCSEHSRTVADYGETCELNGKKSAVFDGIDECCKYIGFGSSVCEPRGLSLECEVEVQANFVILNEKCMIEKSEPRRKTDKMLRSVYEKSISEPDHEDGILMSDCNGNLIKFNLDNIRKSVGFSFVSGMDNPADKITLCLSFKSLMKCNYHKGPNIRDLDQASKSDFLGFKLPIVENLETIEAYSASTSIKESLTVKLEHLIPLERYSNINKLISVHAKVLECWDRWKGFINKSHGFGKKDLRTKALTQIISREQQIHFPDVIDYLSSNSKTKMAMPNLISQLNLYPDTHNLIRVNCKFNEKRSVTNQTYPILLSRESTLTKLIILDEHLLLKHAGCYALLTELRRKFWIPKFFSTVKRILKECVVCRRYNQRPVKLNQSAYREFRLSPSDKPFVEEFLRALSLHSFEYGVPQFIVSDLGTQIVAGANIVQDFLKDAETVKYLTDNNVEKVHFQQNYKGCSQLGGLVESVVKMTKHMIRKSIRNNVIEFRDFEYLVCHAVHLINRRPIAFKEALRDCSNNVPTPITPEELIHGYSLVSLNIIPALQADPDSDKDFQLDFDVVHKIKTSYEQLKQIRTNLLEIYHREFMNT
ncbi:uncharacterized protein [Palaemon carinicauda]|uniref:uncharacterized protein n=1 Tax=Palaemon carinicauda TaxID=392227 RepID=UPI0035B5C336